MFDKNSKTDQASNPGNSVATSAKPAANESASPQQSPRLPAYVMHG